MNSIKDTRALKTQISTVNRQLRTLQREYDSAPHFWGFRTKTTIAEEIVRLERTKAEYARQLNSCNATQRKLRLPLKPAVPCQLQDRSSAGMQMVRDQQEIDELYQEIGKLGRRIAPMEYCPERKCLIEQHQGMIRKRRRLIAKVNKLDQK